MTAERGRGRTGNQGQRCAPKRDLLDFQSVSRRAASVSADVSKCKAELSRSWSSYHDRVEECLDKTLKSLGTDYLDLYLVHWPV